jgi:hypothetical protein
VPLAAGELDSSFADDRVVAGREALDELRGVCSLGRRFDLALRGVRARYAMFSRTVPPKSAGSCGTTPIIPGDQLG